MEVVNLNHIKAGSSAMSTSKALTVESIQCYSNFINRGKTL
jgi:hypothetical protein